MNLFILDKKFIILNFEKVFLTVFIWMFTLNNKKFFISYVVRGVYHQK